jgi:hypothetical protein
MDSITTAMRNYVGLNDRGFLLGSADSLQALKDMLDIMGSESTEEPSAAKRAATMVDKAPVLSKKPLSDKINQLCGQDAEGLMKLLEGANNPSVSCYDAQGIFTTDDLNFSQRYFSQWLEQVLGGTI